MKSRRLKLTAVGVAMVAVADALMAVPALLVARQHSEFPFHDTYVLDVFGLPWWVLPSVLFLIAAFLLVWSLRAARHERQK